jgi:glycerol kinase
MAKYVGAIDQGTTRTRFMIFDHDGREVARHQLEHEQIRPAAGRLEHDPHEIWETTQDVVTAAMGRAGITAADLAAIGIAEQRATTVVWDRRTGEAYCHAIVEGDVRTGADGPTAAGSIRWILQHVDDARADAEAGHAIFGSLGTWLLWWLTGGPDGGRHLTDVTNAGRTGLTTPEPAWDDALLAAAGIPASMLPQIRSSSEVYAATETDGPFGGEVPVAGVLRDLNASLVGQACLAPGDLTMVGATLVLNTGTEPVHSTRGLLTTPAYRFGDAATVHALEGTVTGRVEDVVDAMAADSGLRPRLLHGDASATTGGQELADALGVPVSRPVVVETAALGAAYAAGLAVGFWSSTDELVAGWNEAGRCDPGHGRA